MQTKTIFASKTLWLNVLTITLAILSMTQPEMIGIPAETLLWLNGALNIVLRFMTTGAVSLTGQSATPVTPKDKE